DDYDLYIYSEDDTLITEASIEAFLAATAQLPPGYLAGFLRTEEHDGIRYCSSAHNHYHWDPTFLLEAGDDVYGHFSNPHSACFLLTRSQLRTAIDSGGFLQPPREGRYSMRVTAATDPYTQCGFTKVLPLGRFEEHLLPHLTNRYIGDLGVRLDDMRAQIQALRDGRAEGPVLFDPVVGVDDFRWDTRFHRRPAERLVETIASDASTVLSVGAGSGALEAALAERGLDVVAIPLDPVIAAVAERRGVPTVSPDLELALFELADQRFDAIVLDDVLWRLPNPVVALRSLRRHLHRRGRIITTAPNLLSERLRVRSGRSTSKIPTCFDHREHGVHEVDAEIVRGWFRAAGLGGESSVAYDRTEGPRWLRPARPVSARQLICTVRNARTAAPALIGTATPEVTIGMPVRNGARHLAEALDSARAQTADGIEIVVADNASDDETEEICRAAMAADPRIAYHRHERDRGAAYNYRFTFARSQGRYFTWLAHDDARSPDFVARCLAEFTGDEPPALVYTGVRYVDGDGTYLDSRFDRIASSHARPHRRLNRFLTEVSRANAVFGLARSDVLARTRLIDSFIASDLVLLAEIAMLGEIREVPDELAIQRIHDGMSTHANRDRRALASWFDPDRPGQRLSRTQRLALEYGRSLSRLPLTPGDRLASTATTYATMASRDLRTRAGRIRLQRETEQRTRHAVAHGAR
ncbi:MAG: glycosyltransferase, partial [Actinomycetota bacterium]